MPDTYIKKEGQSVSRRSEEFRIKISLFLELSRPTNHVISPTRDVHIKRLHTPLMLSQGASRQTPETFQFFMMTAWIGYILSTWTKAVFLLYKHHDTHKTSNRFTFKTTRDNLTCCLEILQVNRQNEHLKFYCKQPVLCWNISRAKRVGIGCQQGQRAKLIYVPRLRLLMHHRHGHFNCIACIIHTETTGISIFTHRT